MRYELRRGAGGRGGGVAGRVGLPLSCWGLLTGGGRGDGGGGGDGDRDGDGRSRSFMMSSNEVEITYLDQRF